MSFKKQKVISERSLADDFFHGSKLAVVEFMVVATQCEELAVGAGFDKFTVPHDKDVIGVADGG